MPSEHRRIFHRGALMHLAFLVYQIYQKESGGLKLPLQTAAYTRFSTV
ncbi:hypothetical protein [uncultured Oscillibacter sp.]|nr:hypothetical protein [uncultured Oscillibacter sp.]